MSKVKSRLWPAVTGSAAFICSIAVAIASVYGALYLLIPSLEPREQLGTEITQIAVTHDVSYERYSGKDYSEENPRGTGIEILVGADLRAFKTRSYAMRVKLLDAKNYTEIYVGIDQPFVGSCANKSPAAEEDSMVWKCWFLAPEAGTEYLVRAEIYDSGPLKDLKSGEADPTEEPVAFLDSKVFVMPDV